MVEVFAIAGVSTSDFPAESEVKVESELFVFVAAGLNKPKTDMDRGGFKTLTVLSIKAAAVVGCVLLLEAGGFALFFAFPLGSELLCSLFPALLIIFGLDEGSWALLLACDKAAANWSGVAAEVAGTLTDGILTAIWGMLTITSSPQAQGEIARGGPDGSN